MNGCRVFLKYYLERDILNSETGNFFPIYETELNINPMSITNDMWTKENNILNLNEKFWEMANKKKPGIAWLS